MSAARVTVVVSQRMCVLEIKLRSWGRAESAKPSHQLSDIFL